jgi:hypothetical protein
MSEKFFWNWLNIGRDGQPIDGESGGGQRPLRSSLPSNTSQPLEMARSLASVLWLVLMLAISPLVLGRVFLDKLVRLLVKPMIRLDRFANGN